MVRQVICALDTGNIEEALRITHRMSPYVSSFKIGHALTLPHGLDVVERLKDAGAERIFLDLKFHDTPDVVAVAVREAAKHGVWMMTLHITGGPAMMQAAVEEANQVSIECRPLLIGITVLSSIDQHNLSDQLAVNRSVQEQSVHLARLGMDFELDGVGGCPDIVPALRNAIGHGIIVCRGVRRQAGQSEKDTLSATQCQAANYLVVGRALIDSEDPSAVLHTYGFANVRGGSVLA